MSDGVSRKADDSRRWRFASGIQALDLSWSTLAAVATLVVIAATVRLVNLTGLPSGLHGDEAVVGLEARRVLEEGWIGLYSPHAAGQPAGPLYFWAPLVSLFDHTIFAVRILPAIVGTVTVVLTFLLLRRDLGGAGAFAAALLLAAMTWHIHYSRIAFPIIFWPVVILSCQWALVRAFQTRERAWWVAAGVLSAAGVYVYNAHWMAGAAIAVAGVAYLAWEGRGYLRTNLRNVTFAGVWAFAILAPILRLALDSESVYTSHFERDTLIGSPQWEASTGLVARAGLIVDRYLDVWWLLIGRGTPDTVDAAGVISMVSLPLLLLVAWGIAVGWQRPALRWWWLTSVCVLLVMPLASALTLDGVPRRPFAMAIPLVVLGGIAIADLHCRLRPSLEDVRVRWVTAVVAGLVAVIVTVPGIASYHTTFARHEHQEWVFLQDFTEAVQFMDGVAGRAQVVVASRRHSIDYETRQFLAPALSGEDWATDDPDVPLGLGSGAIVVVLVGAEQHRAADVEQSGGNPIVTGADTNGLFTALCIRCSNETLAELRVRAGR